MKSNFLFAIVTSVALATAANASFAQTNLSKFKNGVALSEKEPAAFPGSLEETDVNIKAVRQFRKSHPEAVASWSQHKDHYFVDFKEDDIRQKIAFNKKGAMTYALKYYNASQVPEHAKKSVKSTYYDYQITGAQELTIGRETITLVQLTRPTHWITVRLADGEMEQISHLKEN